MNNEPLTENNIKLIISASPEIIVACDKPLKIETELFLEIKICDREFFFKEDVASAVELLKERINQTKTKVRKDIQDKIFVKLIIATLETAEDDIEECFPALKEEEEK